MRRSARSCRWCHSTSSSYAPFELSPRHRNSSGGSRLKTTTYPNAYGKQRGVGSSLGPSAQAVRRTFPKACSTLCQKWFLFSDRHTHPVGSFLPISPESQETDEFPTHTDCVKNGVVKWHTSREIGPRRSCRAVIRRLGPTPRKPMENTGQPTARWFPSTGGLQSWSARPGSRVELRWFFGVSKILGRLTS